MVVTVSQNAELANPEWLFSFVHIFSKESVQMILPNLSTHKVRYDEFEFVEGPNVGIGEIPFPYTGQYNYGIWEQPSGSGNLDPALAYNKVETGTALLIATSANTTNDYYLEYLSTDEDDSNIIFAPDELNPPSSTPLVPTPTTTITPSVTPTVTITETITQTPTPTITPTITETVTQTPTSSVTPTITETVTPTITQTITPTSSQTPTPTPTVTLTTSITPTLTTTPTPTPTLFNTEYQSILTRATELAFDLPSSSEQRRQNQLVTDLKGYGIWSKLGFLYVFGQNVATVGTPSLTLINWITPANTVLSLIRQSSGDSFPSFTNYSGWTFDRLNGIQFISPANVGSATVNPITALSGGSEGVWVMNTITGSTSGDNTFFHTNNNNWNRLLSNDSSGQWLFRGVGLTANADLRGTGFRAGSLSGAVTAVTAVELYSGSTKLSRTKSTTDTGLAGNSMFINGNTNSTTRFGWTCGMFFSGLALTETEMNNFETAMITYYNTPT